MTEKEKLSEEEYKLAEEVIKPIYYNAIQNYYSFAKYGVECFLAGIKAVRLEWHDLRKDPNNLPKRNNELTDRSDVIITDKGIAHYNFRKQKWYVHNFECDMSFSETIIAWCEIPQFKEVKENV